MEHRDVSDLDAEIIFKGVVFNEMKGATDPDRLFYLAMQNNLLPEHTYQYESGGEPLEIPKLTHQQLIDFHKSHYHPSNSWCITYGDGDLPETLEYLSSRTESLVSRQVAKTTVPLATRWSTPKSKEVTCMSKNTGRPENQAAVTWLVGDVHDIYKVFVDKIIVQYLMEGPASPMHKALIQSGLGSAFSTGAGFEEHLRETAVSIGVRGTDRPEVVRDTVLDTLKNVVEEGFDMQRIKGILHGYELNLRHQTPKFGLGASFSIMPAWQHGADAIEMIEVQKNIDRFWLDLENNPDMLIEQLQKITIDNTHRLDLIMRPDEGFNQNLMDLESKLLADVKNNLSRQELDDVFRQGQELRKHQNAHEDLSSLPSLSPTDIDVENNPNFYELTRTDKVTYHLSKNTGGLVYIKVAVPLPELSEEEFLCLPTYSNYLSRTGAGEFDQHAFSTEKKLYTAGISNSVAITEDGTPTMIFSTSCLGK